MERGMEHVDECTEERIGRHLERRFRVPSGIRGKVRTTITFEIDVEGSIGKLICTPRVEPAIEAEIERVIRSLPRFVPGNQGGHAVPVFYQIPLSVRTV
jgi:protein TonB